MKASTTLPDGKIEKIQRRAFLKKAAVAGAALGAGAAASRAGAEETPEHPQPVERKGYRETEHIREYYRLARF